MIIKWAGNAAGINQKLKPGKYGNLYNSFEYKSFKESLYYTMIAAKKGLWSSLPITGKVQIKIIFHSNYDIDNLIKPVLDSLQLSRIITNDSKVKRLYIEQEDKRIKDDELTILVKNLEST